MLTVALELVGVAVAVAAGIVAGNQATVALAGRRARRLTPRISLYKPPAGSGGPLHPQATAPRATTPLVAPDPETLAYGVPRCYGSGELAPWRARDETRCRVCGAMVPIVINPDGGPGAVIADHWRGLAPSS